MGIFVLSSQLMRKLVKRCWRILIKLIGQSNERKKDKNNSGQMVV